MWITCGLVVQLGLSMTRFGFSRMRFLPCVTALIPPSRSIAFSTAAGMLSFRIFTMLTAGLGLAGGFASVEKTPALGVAANAAPTPVRMNCRRVNGVRESTMLSSMTPIYLFGSDRDQKRRGFGHAGNEVEAFHGGVWARIAPGWLEGS